MNEQLPITGSHVYMSPEEIEKWWNTLEEEYNTYLKRFKVILPKKNSSNALWLVYLRKHEMNMYLIQKGES